MKITLQYSYLKLTQSTNSKQQIPSPQINNSTALVVENVRTGNNGETTLQHHICWDSGMTIDTVLKGIPNSVLLYHTASS